MRLRGEITVFLSLIIVCILALFLSLVESARTAGARLYLEMSANSAVASVMSQYNRNLWDMYHLLFLEAESDDAVEESFASYLDYYLEQKNLYPMELKEVDVTEKTMMMDNGGFALEQEILSYVVYRIPDIAADIDGLTKVAEDAVKAGDFRELFYVCRMVGRNTRGLETCQRRIEDCLRDLQECLEELEEEQENIYEEESEENSDENNEEKLLERERRIQNCMENIGDEVKTFSGLIESFEKQVQVVSEHLEELKTKDFSAADMEHAGERLDQEILAYEQVISSAEVQLEKYQKAEKEMKEALDDSEQNSLLTGEWISLIKSLLSSEYQIDKEKQSALKRVEELFQGDLLTLVLPEGQMVSKKQVSLRGVPSSELKKNAVSGADMKHTLLEQCMINEYCFLNFDSFLNLCERKLGAVNQPLLYEQEYLLCGHSTDRENLHGAVEKLLSVRAGMNLLFLMQSPEHRASVDGLVAAVSGGIAPVQFILSFFIMTLWSLGEAVCDLKLILNGGCVPFWKENEDWNLSIEGLLELKFLNLEGVPRSSAKSEEGNDYQDYLKIAFLIMDKQERNGRMMDIIQWNIGTIQENFLVSDCIADVQIRANVTEQHMFVVKTEYERSIEVIGDY